MLSFLGRRLLSTIPVLLIVAVLVFLMLRLTPGDPAAVLAGDAASTDQIAQIRKTLGLDRSIPEQFFIWFGHLLTGDLGQSYYYKTEVTTLIGQRLEPTVSLALITISDRGGGVGAAGRAGGLALRRLARPHADGLFGDGLFGAGVRAGLPADLAGEPQARLAAGAGLQAHRRRRGARGCTT